MEKKTAFDKFAPTLLKVYRRDKDAFWSAVMAPFLKNDFSLFAWFKHLKVDVGLLSAFQGLDDEARLVLKDFSAPYNVDVSTWESNRIQYFKDAYPVFAFLAVWMDEEGLTDLVEQFGDILRAGVYAVAGYGILDANVDSNNPSPVEMLIAQSLIAEYETLALNVFGITKVNLEIIHRMRTLFLGAEIKEKSMRWKGSPYHLDDPKDLGTKGANAVTPYMLSLERLGKASLIDEYWEVFLLFGAAIQMIDDWQDLEGDLSIGHYSYVTLGSENLYGLKDTKMIARMLQEDKKRVHNTYAVSKDMIQQSRVILDTLNDRFLGKLVDVTELRLDTYFQKELKMTRIS
jgi:hypothetical protein